MTAPRQPPFSAAGPAAADRARPLPLPLYHRAYLLLCQRLDALPAAETRLPGEHELAAELGVSRITLRRALARLEAEGRIIRRRGDGTRSLRAPAAGRAMSGDTVPDTVAQLLRIGRETETEVLRLEDVAAPAKVAAGLGIAAGAPVRSAEILRRLAGMPVSHLSAFFPATPRNRRLTARMLARRPLLAVTEQYGGPVCEVHQTVSAVLADAPLASLLAVEAGAPLVRIARRFLGERGPLQVSLAHYRADCFEFATVERRSAAAGSTGGGDPRCEIAMRLAERDGVRRG